MSMLSHGKSRLYWVWRWQKGLLSWDRPPIHILEGENVCIHNTSPAQVGSALASNINLRISSAVVSRPLEKNRQRYGVCVIQGAGDGSSVTFNLL